MPVVYALLFFLWVGLVWVEFVFVVPFAVPVALVAATGAGIGRFFVVAWRTLTAAGLDGPSAVPRPAADAPDPAYPQYLLGQVWRDARTLTLRTLPWCVAESRRTVAALTARLLRLPQGLALFPIWLALCAGILLAALPLTVAALVFAVVTVTVAGAGLAAWSVCVLVLGTVERLWSAYRRILLACPHPGCYERLALPAYACPDCGARHLRLVPNRLGAFRHVCRCGARLPTTILLGRFRLSAYCPHCERPLPARIGRARVEPLPFVGGPAAGKTTLMFLAVRALRAGAAASGGRADFVEARDSRAYTGALAELGAGGRLAKTGPELPAATMLDVSLPAGHRILYLFDPAGELHTGATRVERLRYLDHGEALLFVIDPFALPELRPALSQEERLLVEETATSEEDPADTLQRLLADLRSRDDQGRHRRIAVVVTKADVLRRTAVGRDVEKDVRGWLEGVGLGNTIRTLERTAGHVRYLASGLDTPPAALAGLFGWAAGLPLDGRVPEPTGYPGRVMRFQGPETEARDGGMEPPDPETTCLSPEAASRGQGTEPPGPETASQSLEAEAPGRETGDRTGTSERRVPWHAAGRSERLVPLGYRLGRGVLLTALTVLGPAALLLLGLTGYARFR